MYNLLILVIYYYKLFSLYVLNIFYLIINDSIKGIINILFEINNNKKYMHYIKFL